MSEDTTQYHFNVLESTGEVVIRHGEALPVREPQKISLSGDINTPREFYEKRANLFSHNSTEGHSYDSNETNVVIDKKKGTVILTVNEASYFSDTIIGKLVQNPILAKLNINDDRFQGFLPAELAKVLRMHKSMFTSAEFFNTLINSLNDFKAKFETEFEQKNDKKGNVANSVIKNLVSKHDFNFSLSLPLFEGISTTILPIEVDISYSGDASIRCQLFSPELEEEIEKIKESVIEGYKELFDFCPVIVQ